jgi:rod shape-determining protein MreD
MAKKVIWTVVFTVAAALLQSTILRRLAIYRAVPDLALGIIVYAAYVNGTMMGQLSGFFSGFFLDLLSAAPLGLNALVRTLIGALTGFIKGTFFLDVVFLPMALCAGATLIKALVYFLLHLFMAGKVPSYDFMTPVFWVELAMNIVTAPLLFGFLKLFEPLLVGRRASDGR